MKYSVFSTKFTGYLGAVILFGLISCSKEEIKPITDSQATSITENNSGPEKPSSSNGEVKADSEVYPGTFQEAGEDENGAYIECRNTQSICFIVVRPNTAEAVIQTPEGDIPGDILDGEEVRDPATGDTKWYYEPY